MWLMNYRKIWVKYRWSLELWRFLDLFQLFLWTFSKALHWYRVSLHQIPSKKSNILWKSWKMRIYRNCFPLIQRYVWIKRQTFFASLFWFWIYSIFILEFQVKITTRNGADGDPQKGKAFIHYNQKLCRKEIERLFTHFNIEDPGEMSADISYGTNGHKSVCRYLSFSNLIVFCIYFSGLKCQKLFKLVQSCSNLSEIVLSCLNMFKLV